MLSGDLLEIVEAAYRLDAPDSEWLDGVAQACRPALDEAFGVCVFEFEHQMGSAPQILRRAKLGIPEELSKV